MNQTVKTVVFWLVILLSAVLLWQVVRAGGAGAKEKEIAFSQFLQDVDHGDVSEVSIVGQDVHGKYKGGNAGFLPLFRPMIRNCLRTFATKA